MTRLTCFFIILAAVLVIAYAGWVKRAYPPQDVCQGCPGPVEPVPRIKDHVAAVAERECRETQECLTWNRLKQDYGVELVCEEMEDRWAKVRPVNPYDRTVLMPCSKVVGVKVSKDVWVEGGKR